MNNSSYRIRTQNNDKNINININQNFNTLEILSLKLYQQDLYNSDFSDYGVVVGRVLSNNVGIPNCKVSVFIPLDENESNETIQAIYPFSTPNDKSVDDEQLYNVLPRFKTNNNLTNPFGDNQYGLGFKPEKPVGQFYTKEHITNNQVLIEVYKDYYKYTTVTNDSGDYCLVGVPVGTQTIHVDCDITDIGRFSVKPVFLNKVKGFDDGLFQKNGTQFRNDLTLEQAGHIQSVNVDVDVIPFVGLEDVNEEEREIGITRQDITLSIDITPTITIFGNGFTMKENAYWLDDVIFRWKLGFNRLQISIPLPTINIPVIDVSIDLPDINFCLPAPIYFPLFTYDNTTNSDILNGGKEEIPSKYFILASPFLGGCSASFLIKNTNVDATDFYDNSFSTNNIDLEQHRLGNIKVDLFDHSLNINQDPTLVPENNYVTFNNNGTICLIVGCNTRRKITNEFGDLVDSTDGSGIPTEFKGSIHARINDLEIGFPDRASLYRTWFKIPQNTEYSYTDINVRNIWLRNNQTFEFGKIYSYAQKWAVYQDSGGSNDFEFQVGCILNHQIGTNNTQGIDAGALTENIVVPNNNTKSILRNKWSNFSLYFLQSGISNVGKRGSNRTSKIITGTNGDELTHYARENYDDIGGGLINSAHLTKGSVYQTKFLEVPHSDIVRFLDDRNKSNFNIGSTTPLVGNYADPVSGNLDKNNNFIYFKGLREADMFQHVLENNLI